MTRSGVLPPLPARPLLLGHRGAPREAPENTLRAFDLALARGADGVELDVQRTADGVPVVLHDDTLERTTDGRGAVAELNAGALRSVRAGGEAVPTLAQAVEWAAARDAWLNVELKTAGVEESTLQLLRAARWTERTVVSSFLPDVVLRMVALAPDVRCFLLTERWDAAARAALRRTRADGVCLEDAAAAPAALRSLRDAGVPVIVWTVDDPARIEALMREGVVAVITNF